MAHLLDFSKGFAAFASVNGDAWHGYNQNRILPTDTVADIQRKAGADFNLKLTPVMYEREMPDGTKQMTEAPNLFAQYRDDTGRVLSTVTKRYKPVQPNKIYSAMEKWCKEGGYAIETAGVLCDGGRYWVQANTNNVLVLPGKEKVAQFLTLATSADGSMVTEGFTGERCIVCDNTLQAARHENVLMIRNRHSTEVDFDAMAIKLQVVSNAWKDFSERARKLAETKAKGEQIADMLLMAYHGFKTLEQLNAWKQNQVDENKIQKLVTFGNRLNACFTSSPGADLAARNGTLWGVVQAVTFDIDHNGIGRTDEAKFIAAQWGKGNDIKSRIWDICNQVADNKLALVA